MRKVKQYEGWISVYESGTDYDADLVRDRLGSAGISAVVLTQRDHAFNLTVGRLSTVLVMVPPDEVETAEALLAEAPFTDDELIEASQQADPNASPAYPPDIEQMLDSGIEKIRFPSPETPDEYDEGLA